MTRNKWVAVTVGLALVAFFLFGNVITSFFTKPVKQEPMQQTSGVVTEDIITGEGDLATTGDTVTVHYVGTLTSGQVFDSSRDRNDPFIFTLGEGRVIRGWEEGIVGMREGGTRRLTIYPDYGYGTSAVGPIPANSTLIFEVELLNVGKRPQQ